MVTPRKAIALLCLILAGCSVHHQNVHVTFSAHANFYAPNPRMP